MPGHSTATWDTTGAMLRPAEPPRPDPAAYGIGARLSVYPLAASFVDVILDALATAHRPRGLEVATDDVSTFVRGTEDKVARYVRDVVALAAESGHHIAGHLMLSRGCPGEMCREALPSGQPWAPSSLARLLPTGHRMTAHWSIYPLVDGVAGAAGRRAAHLPLVEEAIDQALRDGTHAGTGHFVTRLDGDVADVLGTVFRTWVGVGLHVQHVVAHVTFSIHARTAPGPVGERAVRGRAGRG